MSAYFKTAMMAAATVLLSACATNVSVDYDRSINFSDLKTYALLPKAAESTADKRLSSPLIDERIVNAIKNNMTAKGFRYDAKQPDMQLVYQIDLKQEIASDGSGVTMAIGSGGRRGAFGMAYTVPGSDVQTYERGRLTIDINAAKTSKLLWRGTSSRRIYDASSPESNEKLINEIVTEILDKYPPGK